MVDLSFKLNPRARELPACSAVLHGIARQYHVDNYRTTLSVKAVARGAALYTTPHARHLVTEDSFLVLNEGQQYSLEFQWPSPTETICPFFQPGFLEHVAYCSSAPVAKQLDDLDTPNRRMGFYEHLYPRTGRVGRLLDELQRGILSKRVTSIWLEDRMYELAGALARLSGDVTKDVEKVAAMRSSTRVELYRRLHHGRDFLSACYASSVGVSNAARAANLSPAHFHRQFKALFRQTPMQFLQWRRLAAARSLLLGTDELVTRICFMIGFESLGSFSSLFRRRFGCSPYQYRRLHSPGRKKQS